MSRRKNVKGDNLIYTSEFCFDENFQKIIRFYLFECPIENVSHRGSAFKDFGWTGSKRLQMMENLLKETSQINDEQWNILNSPSEVRIKSKNIVLDKQFIYSDKSKGRVKTFIYSIRNSFAHGSFDVFEKNNEKYYFMENEYRGNLRSRMFLKESTLISWISIIKTRPEYLTKKARKKSKVVLS